MYEKILTGVLSKSWAWPRRKQSRKHVTGERDFNNIETRTLIKFFFFTRQGAEGISFNSDRNISLFPLLVKLRTYQCPCICWDSFFWLQSSVFITTLIILSVVAGNRTDAEARIISKKRYLKIISGLCLCFILLENYLEHILPRLIHKNFVPKFIFPN